MLWRQAGALICSTLTLQAMLMHLTTYSPEELTMARKTHDLDHMAGEAVHNQGTNPTRQPRQLLTKHHMEETTHFDAGGFSRSRISFAGVPRPSRLQSFEKSNVVMHTCESCENAREGRNGYACENACEGRNGLREELYMDSLLASCFVPQGDKHSLHLAPLTLLRTHVARQPLYGDIASVIIPLHPA